ncbi:MAG: TrkH family potassium uptake protein, partial [Clostridiaceae bacterium]|nr:TrkH family potassium uptake protein [Clostridiaceae bacterium]
IYTMSKKMTLHSKIAITITLALVFGGTISFYLLENNNPGTFAGMSWLEKFYAAFFQSVTSRTAGFNTIDLTRMTEPSKLLTVILMFIGGSPGSTAGGIKTVTFGVTVITALAVVKGNDRVSVFGKRLSPSVVNRSFTIVMIALFVVIIGVMVLSITEKASLMEILFEVVSAFGTVGLTLGLTQNLTNVGKTIIIVIMYFGRVGVFTVAFGLMKIMNNGVQDKIHYAEEKIMVG